MNDEQISAIENALAVLSGGERSLLLPAQRLLVKASFQISRVMATKNVH